MASRGNHWGRHTEFETGFSPISWPEDGCGDTAGSLEFKRSPALPLYSKQMKPKPYIVWSKREIDLSDPWQRKWYLQQVLIHGKAEDVARLDWQEIRRLLPDLTLPSHIRQLWEEHFANLG
jgi:hypothetical protein